MCQALFKVLLFINSFIHSSIKYVLGAFLVQGLTQDSRDMEINSPVGYRSLCSVMMQCWPLFQSISFFPKRTMLFRPLKKPPSLTWGKWEGSKPGLQVRHPTENSLFSSSDTCWLCDLEQGDLYFASSFLSCTRKKILVPPSSVGGEEYMHLSIWKT